MPEIQEIIRLVNNYITENHKDGEKLKELAYVLNKLGGNTLDAYLLATGRVELTHTQKAKELVKKIVVFLDNDFK